ncbi:trans-aconitate 2-methyltransferase [Synechococcus sp. CS-1332]|uniref:class I SAM-dependent methyltransferase n=1 Tax=Synechococcus sp. CS-1332 TaxID=2847972 RepID=UPI00223B9968|nr:methyltransferase domain-containing protein [Synechococcus sp. CS-1332]
MSLPRDAAGGAASVQKPALPGLEEQILASWATNAVAWTRAVRRGEILSRERVTNGAILEAIRDVAPRTLLDLGCGEGWLAHQCALQGIEVLGTDAVAELTAIATESAPPGARFQTLTYQDIATGSLNERFEVVVANFSLLGDRSLGELSSPCRSCSPPVAAFWCRPCTPC